MKYFLVFLLLVITRISFGQTNVYHSFPDSAFWRVDILVYSPMGGGCQATYFFQYYTSGDTTIHSSTFRKIYKSAVLLTSTGSASPCDPIPFIEDSGYMGALRDDSVLNKVFFVLPGSSFDTLLYDYNLVPGDSVKGLIGQYCPTVVNSVDSITIDGTYRKRWNCDACGHPNEYIIEGIGSSFGLIEYFAGSPASQKYGRLVCVKDSTLTLFVSSYISSIGCVPVFSGEQPMIQENNFLVNPNPFTSELNIHTHMALKDAHLSLYNSQGQLVREIRNVYGNNITLMRDDLKSGLYMIELIENSRSIIKIKIIIDDY